MQNFDKAVKLLQENGFEVQVEEYIYPRKQATFQAEDVEGGFTTGMHSMTFNDEELEIIRELLSSFSCNHKRTTYYYHCCDANELITRIDNYFESKGKKLID